VSVDYTGVKLLLEAGAQPNVSGNPYGERWESGHILATFNQLHGASPLYICKHLAWLFKATDDCDELRDEGERKRIEDILRSYGAVESSNCTHV
jgi:hypothetical protein